MSPTMITLATAAVLVVVDVAIVASFYRYLRTQPPYDRRLLDQSKVGLACFVVQALICFEGAFLVAQLAAIAAIYGLCRLSHAGRLSKAAA